MVKVSHYFFVFGHPGVEDKKTPICILVFFKLFFYIHQATRQYYISK